MDIIITVISILLILSYLRFFFKRLRLLLNLKKAAKRCGAKIKLIAPSFYYPTNKSKRYELMITGEDYIYCIKVIGLFQKYCDLHFWNPREYGTRKYLLRFQIDQATPLGSKDTRHKHLDINFSAGLPENSENKQIVHFYLLSPANSPIHITKNEGNTIVDLMPGDKINDIIFADREYLYQYIALGLHQRMAKR